MEKEKFELSIDSALLKQGKDLFEDLGLSLENAVAVFIKQAVREQGLPFKPTRNIADAAIKVFPDAESRKLEKPGKISKMNIDEKNSMLDLDCLR